VLFSTISFCPQGRPQTESDIAWSPGMRVDYQNCEVKEKGAQLPGCVV